MDNAATEMEKQLDHLSGRSTSPRALRGDGTFISLNGEVIRNFEVLSALYELQEFVARAKHLIKAIPKGN